jgi:hypothetical protein
MLTIFRTYFQIENSLSPRQWLTPMILGTEEVPRIQVQSQPPTNSSQDPISKTPITEKGLEVWFKQ